jgi:tetratricopeptide (TPR) repeat protein
MLVSTFLLVASLSPQAPVAQAPVPAAESADALGQAYFLFLRGHMLDARDDIDGALAAYRQAADLWPRGADIRADLASLFARQGKVDEAVKEANAALAIDGENRAAHRILGLVQAELADATPDELRARSLAEEGIRHLEIVAADKLVDPTSDLALGRLYVRAGRDDRAIATLRDFLLDHPDYPEALQFLAEAYEHSRQLPAAVEVVQQLAAGQPDQPRILAWLAELQEQTGDWQSAATAWTRLADGNPRNPSYRLRQATALVNAGDAAGGRKALATITEQMPRDASAWYLLSQIDRRSGDAARVEEDARHIAEIDPADPRGPLALADAKATRGDYRGAVATLDPAVRAARAEDVASGSYGRLVGSLAHALQQTGEPARAVTVLEEARLRDSSNSQLLFDLGAAYDHAKRFDQAEQTFREVIASQPANADALNYLGYMLADRGNKLDEAVALITRALAIEADNPSFLDSLGWAYVKQAKLDRARDPLQRAAAALPTTSVIQDHLAELYFQLKLYREAATAWDRALAGDGAGIDSAVITKKRDRARTLAGR